MSGQSEAAKPPYSAQTGWSVRRESINFADLTTLAFRPPLLCEEGNIDHCPISLNL